KPETFIYISCKPTSLKNDLPVFLQNGYKVTIVQCVDMFPQTPHVETCVLLSHKNSHTSAPSL
ncbi:MAG: 23S rRNA (uracil(1939)-C(5))-methyltransferase RlmD, partial [Tissierellia bacterium]|nr:23S rRNA (uracil(1939)-C(5))-methyltransferase RlmD [Tissierellia bacterium]